MDNAAAKQFDAIGLSAEIVGAFISNNSVRPSDLPTLIFSVHSVVSGLANGGTMAAPAVEPDVKKAIPAQIRKSITPDALISFIDGKPYKTLKRHLGTHGLDFASYRARYGLPADYPTVAPSYSAARSALAKNLELGQGRSKAPEPAQATSDKPKRGRPAKTAA